MIKFTNIKHIQSMPKHDAWMGFAQEALNGIITKFGDFDIEAETKRAALIADLMLIEYISRFPPVDQENNEVL